MGVWRLKRDPYFVMHARVLWLAAGRPTLMDFRSYSSMQMVVVSEMQKWRPQWRKQRKRGQRLLADDTLDATTFRCASCNTSRPALQIMSPVEVVDRNFAHCVLQGLLRGIILRKQLLVMLSDEFKGRVLRRRRPAADNEGHQGVFQAAIDANALPLRDFEKTYPRLVVFTRCECCWGSVLRRLLTQLRARGPYSTGTRQWTL